MVLRCYIIRPDKKPWLENKKNWIYL